MPSEPYLAEIYMAGMNFAPQGYALCQGQLLPIAQYAALFSLVGTTFGGDGQTTFALPDLRGRVPVGFGQGNGLSNKVLGELAGVENITLSQAQMPQHTHQLIAVNQAGAVSDPTGAYLANSGPMDKEYITSGTTVAMNTGAMGTAGGSQPHTNLPPYLVLTFYIALEGIYPSRP